MRARPDGSSASATLPFVTVVLTTPEGAAAMAFGPESKTDESVVKPASDPAMTRPPRWRMTIGSGPEPIEPPGSIDSDTTVPSARVRSTSAYVPWDVTTSPSWRSIDSPSLTARALPSERVSSRRVPRTPRRNPTSTL